MTKEEFESLKVGDRVKADVWRKMKTGIVETKGEDELLIRLDKPIPFKKMEFRSLHSGFCTYYVEPETFITHVRNEFVAVDIVTDDSGASAP